MKDQKQKASGGTGQKGRSKGPGKKVNPINLPRHDAPASPTEHRTVPIGRPVSQEEYRKLKEQAAKGKPLPGIKGQEDSSA